MALGGIKGEVCVSGGGINLFESCGGRRMKLVFLDQGVIMEKRDLLLVSLHLEL